MEMRCINCNLNLYRARRMLVFHLDTRVISLIAQRISPRILTESDYICVECWQAAMRAANEIIHGTHTEGSSSPTVPTNETIQMPIRVIGHSRTCLRCGCSVLRCRSELIIRTNPTERQRQIHEFVSRNVALREVSPNDRLCHNCHRTVGCLIAQMHQTEAQIQEEFDIPVQAVTGLQTMQSTEVTSLSSSPRSSGSEWLPASATLSVPQDTIPSILLPNYKRAVGSSGNCALPHCTNLVLQSVSEALRINLVKDHKLFLPPHIKICMEHMLSNDWHILYDNGSSSFTAQNIEQVFSFINNNDKINFKDILNIDDNLFKYWVGLTKDNFLSIINEVPGLASEKNKTGLVALLIKYRSGDSNTRLASLMKISRRTLEGLMSKVRNILMEQYVPRHLGLAHMTRQQMLSHNLLIHDGIYGHGINPVFIWDGTYNFTYKSSNYSFQKDSYSLHKYRNLLKPMMVVLSDGYILDCLGPYKAITSDAQIMLSLFSGNENNLVSQHFSNNDVFILDRGFRDAVRLLGQCGYAPHMPESVLPGHTQLTTAQANKSRCITICRWVVEVVNGHMKRDYRLFRHEFNNKALPHLMQDFKIAAALYNNFSQRLKDRSDAQNILARINERYHLPNNLADVVQAHHLNRRTANFVSITGNLENLLYFPRFTHDELILFSLGTYQIRQAHSYYSEHVKINGAYIVEVCSELPTEMNLSEVIINAAVNENVTLMRGKIRSRHVSRKIYYVYLLIKDNTTGINGILEYYCNCIVGRRTLGCCAHVMTVVWYLGWARYQDNIVPPAEVLNDVFIE